MQNRLEKYSMMHIFEQFSFAIEVLILYPSNRQFVFSEQYGNSILGIFL